MEIEIKIGADPEFFLYNEREKIFVNPKYMVPGSKEKPYSVPGGAVQVDGLAVEINITPSTNYTNFAVNTNSILRWLRSNIPNHFSFVFKPTVMFDKEYLKEQPKKSLEAGCDPDFDAYRKGMFPNPKPQLENQELRTAAGHIHIGWTSEQNPEDKEHIEACKMLTKQLDRGLFPAERYWCKDEDRRKFYGKRGAYRPKHYGLEYRVLSNSWLSSGLLTRYVFLQTKYCTSILLRGQQIPSIPTKIYFYRQLQNPSFHINNIKGVTLQPRVFT